MVLTVTLYVIACLTAVLTKWSVPSIYIVLLVFSLATLNSGKLDLGVVSAGSNGIEL